MIVVMKKEKLSVRHDCMKDLQTYHRVNHVLNYLEDSHGASLIGVSNDLLTDQTGVGGGDRVDPGLDLKSKE